MSAGAPSEPHLWILHAGEVAGAYQSILGGVGTLHFLPSLRHLLARIRDAASAPASLVIANLRPQGESFLDLLCSDVARDGRPWPWLAVAWSDELDRIRACYRHGAAGYLSTPLHAGELQAKVERALRNREETATVAGYEIDPATFTVRRGEQRSPTLTAREFQILWILLRAPSWSAARAEIQARVWRQLHVGPKTLDVHLAHLRAKIGPLGLSLRADGPGRLALVAHRAQGPLSGFSGTDSPRPHRSRPRVRPSRRSSREAALA